MHRRSFLQMLAAAAGTCAFPSIVRAETLGLNGKVAPSSRLCMGVIGVGNMGFGHLKALAGNEEVHVAAICDVDGQHADRALKHLQSTYAATRKSGNSPGAASDCLVTDDFRNVLARSDIDAVLTALPEHWHSLPVILAAHAGKDIYAEKPLALTIPEGRAMVAAVKQSGVVCQTGSQQRSAPEFQRAIEAVRNGLLGEIRRVRVGMPPERVPSAGRAKIKAPLAPQTVPSYFNYDMWLGPAPWAPYYAERCHLDFRFNYDYAGGPLSDWIAHHFDIATIALGVNHTGPVAIKNMKAKFLTGPLYNTPTSYSFDVHYANGPVIELSTANKLGVEIDGSEGSVYVNRGLLRFSNPRLQQAQGANAVPSNGFRMDRISHFRNFTECVRSRAVPCSPVDEAHRTASVAHLANIALRSGRTELAWDPEREEILDAPDAARLLVRAWRSPWQLPACEGVPHVEAS